MISNFKINFISNLTSLDSWSLHEFSNALHVSLEKAREILSFWEKQGILRKSNSNVYSVLEKAEHLLEGMFFFSFYFTKESIY